MPLAGLWGHLSVPRTYTYTYTKAGRLKAVDRTLSGVTRRIAQYSYDGAPSLISPQFLLPPYGGDPVDQEEIAAGEAYFHEHQEELTCGCEPGKP